MCRPCRRRRLAPRSVFLILLDDVGFGHTSTFGGPVNTPTLQRLADEGLRYNRFHTTALCSPSRAALLTGRNHHSVHTGCITELSTGFPSYDGEMPKDAAVVAETLKQNGYNTAAFGKWHNTPDYETARLVPSTAGPLVSASNISGASWAARPTIGTRRSHRRGLLGIPRCRR